MTIKDTYHVNAAYLFIHRLTTPRHPSAGPRAADSRNSSYFRCSSGGSIVMMVYTTMHW